MNGQVIPGTPFAVDFWKIRECPTVKLFFLTHLHGDHTVGLTSSWHQPIYCSPVTGQMLIDLYGIEGEFIRPLAVDTSHMIPLGDTQEIMTVTVLNANHCPGSVMYIFEGYFGKIMHTGDFRYHKDMVNSSNSHFFSNIDTLYLDNTYCNINCVFPPREEVTASIVSLIKSKPKHSFVIGVRNLGKEDLLVSIAQRCDELVSVSMNMYNKILYLGLPSVFLCEDERCRIRTVKFHEVSEKNVTAWNKYKPTIAILPTSLYVGIDHNPFCNVDMVHVYPYSDHSSYSELMEFVEKVQPGKIVPIVPAKSRGPFGSDISLRADMNCFSHLLSQDLKCGDPRPIPLSVREWMTCKDVPFINSLSRSNKNRSKPKLLKKHSVRTRGVVFESSDDVQKHNQEKDSKENEEERMHTIKPSADLICNGSIGTDIHSESICTPPSLWNSRNIRHTSTSDNEVSGKQKNFTVITEKLISSSNERMTSKTQNEPSNSCLRKSNEINVLCRKRMAADDLISECSSGNSDSESHNHLALQRKKKCLPLSPLLKDGTGSCERVEIKTFNTETKEKPLCSSPLVSDGNCSGMGELQDNASGEAKTNVNAGADCRDRADSVTVMSDVNRKTFRSTCLDPKTCSQNLTSTSEFHQEYLNFQQKEKLNDGLAGEVTDHSILSENERLSEKCRNKEMNRKTKLMSKSPNVTSINNTCRSSTQKNSRCCSKETSQKGFLGKKFKSSNSEQYFSKGSRLDREYNSCGKPENATLVTPEKNLEARKSKSRERLPSSESFDVISETIQGLSEKCKTLNSAESTSFQFRSSGGKNYKEKSPSSFTITDYKKRKTDSILKSSCPRPSSKLTGMSEHTKTVKLNSTKNSVSKGLNDGNHFVANEKEKMKALIDFVCVEPIFSVKPLIRKSSCSVKTPGVSRGSEIGVFPIRKDTGKVSAKHEKDKAFVWEVPG